MAHVPDLKRIQRGRARSVGEATGNTAVPSGARPRSYRSYQGKKNRRPWEIPWQDFYKYKSR